MLTLDETTGALRWPTGEGTGPSTNLVSVSVRDNGQPPLSDTTNFNVIVREVNTAPVIATITNRTVSETVLLTVVNTATDQDLPAQGLKWSFTGPTNAAINSTNGVFTWRPTAQQGPSTNRIYIIAKDYGTPQLSATQAFTVFVRDSAADFNLSLGTTNVLGGESNSVPVLLSADVALAQLDFTLDVPPGPVTNLAVVDFGPGVNGVSFVPAGPGRNQVQFQLDGAGTLVTTRTLARLAFATLSNTPSAIVPLQVSNLVGLTTAGTSLLNAAATNGEVIVVNREPVLTARRGAGNARLLRLYGIPGKRYGVEWRPSVGPGSLWQRVTNVLQVERIEAVSLAGSVSNDFYRAVELNLPAGGLVVRPTLVAASNLVVLEMTVLPGCAYVIENSSNLVNWSQQAVAVAESGLLRFTVELDPQDTARFFRARAIPCADQCAPVPAGLVGWWPGDGTGANLAGTNTATLHGGASFGAGHVGGAFAFDGTGYAEVGNPTNLHFWGTRPFTLSAWVKPEAALWGCIVSRYHINVEGEWGLYVTPDLRVEFDREVFPHALFSLNALGLGQFSHVVATYDGSVKRIFINGRLDSEQSSGFSGSANNTSVRIGASITQGQTTYPFTGRIDELMIFNRALRPEEIAALYTAGPLGVCRP